MSETGIPNPRELGWFRFKLGEFECTAVWDGTLYQPYEGIYPNADFDEIKALMKKYGLPEDNIPMDLNVLVVNTGSDIIEHHPVAAPNFLEPRDRPWLQDIESAEQDEQSQQIHCIGDASGEPDDGGAEQVARHLVQHEAAGVLTPLPFGPFGEVAAPVHQVLVVLPDPDHGGCMADYAGRIRLG